MNLKRKKVYASVGYFHQNFSSSMSYFVNLEETRLKPEGDFFKPMEVFFIAGENGEIPNLLFEHQIGAFKHYFDYANQRTIEYMLETEDREQNLVNEWIKLVYSGKFRFASLEEKILKRLAETLSKLSEDKHRMSFLSSNDIIKAKLAEKFTLNQIKLMDDYCQSEFTQEAIWQYRLKMSWGWHTSDKKEFSEKVAEELKKMGLRQDQAWDVIHACGPGYVNVSLAYAEAILISGYNPDLIWLLFGGANGAGEKNGCGYSRTVLAIEGAGVKVPKKIFGSSTAFFKILKGTRLLVRFLSS